MKRSLIFSLLLTLTLGTSMLEAMDLGASKDPMDQSGDDTKQGVKRKRDEETSQTAQAGKDTARALSSHASNPSVQSMQIDQDGPSDPGAERDGKDEKEGYAKAVEGKDAKQSDGNPRPLKRHRTDGDGDGKDAKSASSDQDDAKTGDSKEVKISSQSQEPEQRNYIVSPEEQKLIDQIKRDIKNPQAMADHLFEAPRDYWGRRPCYQAVKLIIESGFNVNDAVIPFNRGGGTPLHIAVTNGDYHIAKLLVDAGINVNAIQFGWSYTTALHRAAEFGRREICILLMGSPRLDPAVFKDRDLLHFATHGRVIEIIEKCLDADTNITITSKAHCLHCNDRSSATVFHCAAHAGRRDICNLFMKRCRLEQNFFNDPELLYSAAHGGIIEIVQKCIDAGVDVNADNKAEQTPLFPAAENGHREICILLMPLVDPAVFKDSELFIRSKVVEVLKKCVESGVDVNESFDGVRMSGNHGTRLHVDAETGHRDNCLYLMPLVDQDIFKDSTLLEAACEGGVLEVVQKCIAAGVDVNDNGDDDFGYYYTPLAWAADKRNRQVTNRPHPNVCLELLNHGADPDKKGAGTKESARDLNPKLIEECERKLRCRAMFGITQAIKENFPAVEQSPMSAPRALALVLDFIAQKPGSVQTASSKPSKDGKDEKRPAPGDDKEPVDDVVMQQATAPAGPAHSNLSGIPGLDEDGDQALQQAIAASIQGHGAGSGSHCSSSSSSSSKGMGL